MIQLPHDTGDFAASFQIEGRPVRGRAVRMGAGSVSPILARHDYPPHLAQILGEAVTLAALVGTSLKFEGRVLVQAEGDGPISLMVGEYASHGGVRGYARYEKEAWANLERVNKGDAPHMPQLFGRSGRLGLILIHDNPDVQPYQGIVSLTKATLSQCAEDYFAMSEQVPSRIRLSVEKLHGEGGWVSGGMMVQRIAGDDARGDTDEPWREAEALFATLTPQELADPALPMTELLFRLFHEQGVTLEAGTAVSDKCTCNEARLVSTLRQMPDESLRELVEPDGNLSIDCQFCARHYKVGIGEVTGPVN
ncbi:Hsp33 family molecular chaperone HslO [Hyphomonas sp.]|uniref:Hsp33 family molecular chaperone HslO n=1 Tax=Hyphomonas sp. TaxID=87 RepID=UPI00391DDD79